MKWNDIVMHECMNDEFTSEASLGIEGADKNETDDPETLRCKFCCINAESPDPIMSDKSCVWKFYKTNDFRVPVAFGKICFYCHACIKKHYNGNVYASRASVRFCFCLSTQHPRNMLP